MSGFVVFIFGIVIFVIVCLFMFCFELCVFLFFLKGIKFNSEFDKWDGLDVIDIGLITFNTSDLNPNQVGLVVPEVLIVYPKS